jgi:hypothetical protein
MSLLPSTEAEPATGRVDLCWIPWAGRFRRFRYEIRRWWAGTIPDVDSSIAVGRGLLRE